MNVTKFFSPYLTSIVIYFLFLNVYEIVSIHFGYWGFTNQLNYTNVFISIIIIIIFINLFFQNSKNDLVHVFKFYWFYFVVIPVLVLFSCETVPFLLLSIHIFYFSFICILFSLKRSILIKPIFLKRFAFRNSINLFLFITIVLFIPFLFFGEGFNWKAFNVLNVYEIRLESREISNPIIGYIKEVCSRVFLPILLVYGILKRNIIYIIIAIFGIIYIYASTGALKSILVVIPVVLLFINSKDYFNIKNKLLFLIFVLLILPLFEYYYVGTYFLTDLPVRRLFFVPGLFEASYLEEFVSDPQFYSNGFLRSFNDKPYSMTKHIGGKYFGKPDMNANVGLVIGGFINLNFIGVALHALVVYVCLAFINGLKVKPQYFGILFVYFYYFNTSFIGTLFLTHGFLALIYTLYIFYDNEKS